MKVLTDQMIEDNWPASAPIRLFIGYDKIEPVAWHVLHHSIQRLTSQQVLVTPLMNHQLDEIHDREWDPRQSTEFAFTRFLIPYLCNYEGYAIFMDSDMLCRSDLGELWAKCNYNYAVRVVKHDYTPKTERKFLDQKQSKYPKKNWSSVMLFNNEKCKALTRRYVEEASGLDLHQFKWLEDDGLIGELPRVWNWLVGEYAYNSIAKLVHFTLGGPWLEETASCDYSDEWRMERDLANYAENMKTRRELRSTMKISEK